MRSSPKNKDWQKHSPGPQSDKNHAQPADPEAGAGRNPAANSTGAEASGKPGRQATRKKKLEDLNDREDLSDRTFSDRNWL